MAIVGARADEETSGAVTIDAMFVEMTNATPALERATIAEAATIVVVGDIEVVVMAAPEGMDDRRVLSGKKKHGKTIGKHARNARLVSLETRRSDGRRKSAHGVVGQPDSVSFQPSVKSTLINGSTKVLFAKR